MAQVKLLKITSGVITQANESNDSARVYSLGLGVDANFTDGYSLSIINSTGAPTTLGSGVVVYSNSGVFKVKQADGSVVGGFSAGGDLTGSATSQTVSKLNGTILDVTTLTDGYVLTYDSSSTSLKLKSTAGGGFVAGGDLSGSSSSQTVVAISGSSPIPITPSVLQWTSGTLTPTISQADNTTASATGATLTIQAQNATGVTSVGGQLNLQSGTGTSSGGGVQIYIPGGLGPGGGNVGLRLNASPTNHGTLYTDVSNFIFHEYCTPVITQDTADGGFTSLFTIKAKSGGGSIPVGEGSSLSLESGQGVGMPDGYIYLKTGNTNNVTLKPNGVVRIHNLSTGIVHSDSSGNLTSSAVNLANSDVTGVLPTGNQASQSLSGDLSGTTSSATVIKINNTSVPASPSANQVLVATAGTTSVWSQIYDGYVAASAAIAGTKISPNFGSQNITTTGTSAALSFDKSASGTLNIGSTTATAVTIGSATAHTTIAGNLTINGTTTSINSTVVDIADRIVHVNHSTGVVAVPSNITGISIHRGSTDGVTDRDHAGLFWDETNSTFKLAYNTTGDDSTLGANLPLTASSATLSGMTTGRVVTTSTSGLLVDTAVLSVTNLPSLAGDVTGTITSNTVSAISGSSPVAITPSTLQWLNTTSAPILKQDDKIAAGNGADLIIQSQKATAASTLGGNLILQSGTGTTQAGAIYLRVGTIDKFVVGNTDIQFKDSSGVALSITPNSTGTASILFNNTPTAVTLSQAPISTANGANFSISSQNSTFGTGTVTAGNLNLSAGGATGSSTNNTGGNVVITAGAASGAGTSNNGGNVTITSGTGATTAGNVNIQTGGTTIAQVTPNKFITSKGTRKNVTIVSGTYQVLVTDENLIVTTNGGAFTITLPASPTTGDYYLIKDGVGNALTRNITVAGNGKNIDGSANYTINVNYAAITFIYNGTEWSAI